MTMRIAASASRPSVDGRVAYEVVTPTGINSEVSKISYRVGASRPGSSTTVCGALQSRRDLREGDEMSTQDAYALALNSLRNHEVFKNTSSRLLADLIEVATPHVQSIPPSQQLTLKDALLVVVLEGDVLQREGTRHIVRSAGTVISKRRGADFILSGSPPLSTLVLPLNKGTLERAIQGSPEFARSLNASACPGLEDLIREASPVELIWLCEAPGVGAPMEALAQLLAASTGNIRTEGGRTSSDTIDTMPDDGTSESTGLIVTGAGNVSLSLRLDRGAEFEKVAEWNQKTGKSNPNGKRNYPGRLAVTDIHRVIQGERPASQFHRLFFVRDRAPNVLPHALKEFKFHRIVYLTRKLPSSIPEGLLAHLHDMVQNDANPSNPLFSSFIPTIILDRDPIRPARSGVPPLRSLFRAIVGSMSGLESPPSNFRTEAIDSQSVFSTNGSAPTPRSRLKRDLCRVFFDPARLEGLWNNSLPLSKTTTVRDRRTARAGPSQELRPFVPLALAAEPSYEKAAARWARAVTNRQVGLALSGGGGSSYRAVPLLRFLHEHGVPIDVIGSSSGGSLLAAYFCRNGLPGLDSYIRGSFLAAAGGLAALLSSQVIEEVLDWVFRDTRVEQLEVRFVPIAMALPNGGAPEARAVVRGTLGEAVRVSGALPLLARSVKKGTLYSDGSLAIPIPARALPSFGADLVFAFSSIPGPLESNPLGGLPGINFLYKYAPLLGRVVELLTANAFFLEQVARAVGNDAAVYIQASPSNASLLEVLRFDQAERLVNESERDPRVRIGAAACAQRWRDFVQRAELRPAESSRPTGRRTSGGKARQIGRRTRLKRTPR
jgi:predicted acylesterase/phospholipase RssA